MVPRISHSLHYILYIEQRGLTPISLYSQSEVADPPAYTLTHTVAYTRQVLLTVVRTIHTHTYTRTYTYTHTLYYNYQQRGLCVYLGLFQFNLSVISRGK